MVAGLGSQRGCLTEKGIALLRYGTIGFPANAPARTAMALTSYTANSMPRKLTKSMNDNEITTNEAAAILGIPSWKLRAWIVQGRLKARKVGRSLFVDKRSVYALRAGEAALDLAPVKAPDDIDTTAAAEMLGISPRRVLKLIETGEIEATKFNNDWVVSKKSVKKYSRPPRGPKRRERICTGCARPRLVKGWTQKQVFFSFARYKEFRCKICGEITNDFYEKGSLTND